MLFCFSDCMYLTPKEKEQKSGAHTCTLHNVRLFHGKVHPHLIRNDKCMYEGTDENLETQIEELNTYTEVEGTEVGEACSFLITLERFPDYVSEEFYQALVKEIRTRLEDFQLNSHFVEKEETHTMKYETLERR